LWRAVSTKNARSRPTLGLVARPRLHTEERIATAVRLPRSLHEQLHAAADERQVAANLLVVKALETFLAQLTPVDELALVREARGPVSQATGTVGE
jgi:microcystin degradation protein MlrC